MTNEDCRLLMALLNTRSYLVAASGQFQDGLASRSLSQSLSLTKNRCWTCCAVGPLILLRNWSKSPNTLHNTLRFGRCTREGYMEQRQQMVGHPEVSADVTEQELGLMELSW
jgi:hypothetical protein